MSATTAGVVVGRWGRLLATLCLLAVVSSQVVMSADGDAAKEAFAPSPGDGWGSVSFAKDIRPFEHPASAPRQEGTSAPPRPSVADGAACANDGAAQTAAAGDEPRRAEDEDEGEGAFGSADYGDDLVER